MVTHRTNDDPDEGASAIRPRNEFESLHRIDAPQNRRTPGQAANDPRSALGYDAVMTSRFGRKERNMREQSTGSIRAIAVILACGWLAPAGCFIPAPIPGPEDSPTAVIVVEDADFPVDLAFAPDGRVFFTEKATGKIRIIKDGALLPVPFATVPVNAFNERGLLGIALHPDFAINGFVYVFYTLSATGAGSNGADGAAENRVSRFTAAGDVAAGAEEVLVHLPVTNAGNHDGGIIRFGPDGKLYVSFGDLGFRFNDAQDATVLPGKILRYNDDGSIPADNPFGPGNPAFAIGLRNPFGMAFDTAGRLYANDNGPNNHDELNLIVAGGNYGWPRVQGFADDGPGDPADEKVFAASHPAYRDPLIDKSDGSVGAAGVAVNPDDVYGVGLRGRIFHGEFHTRRVLSVLTNVDGDASLDHAVFIDNLPGRVTGMAVSPAGELWVATTGAVLRVAPSAP